MLSTVIRCCRQFYYKTSFEKKCTVPYCRTQLRSHFDVSFATSVLPQFKLSDAI